MQKSWVGSAWVINVVIGVSFVNKVPTHIINFDADDINEFVSAAI
jgi:hypothetical protein